MVTLVILFVLRAVFGNLRVSDENEALGLGAGNAIGFSQRITRARVMGFMVLTEQEIQSPLPLMRVISSLLRAE